MKILNRDKILTILKKEILMYMISFSNYLVLATVTGVTMFLFMNNFFLYNSSQLDQFFNLLPWVFAVVVPAVTMGIISQERRSRTLNYLYSNPISELDIVIGKYIAGFKFLSIFLVATLIAPISLSQIAKFDWGVVLSGYIAAGLLLGTFLAINMYISSLFKNPLAVFIIGFVVNFFLIIVGTDMVFNYLPPAWTGWVTQVSPIQHFTQISRGLIQSKDILYFTLLILAFILLTFWQLMRLRSGGLKTWISVGSLSINTVAIALIVATLFTGYVPGSLDITNKQIFTLASGSKKTLQQIADPLEINVYLSKPNDLPPAFRPHLEDIERLLQQFSLNQPDKVKINRKYPLEDQQVAQEAVSIGITPQSFSVLSQNEYQAKEGFLGLQFKYKDQERVIPFVDQTNDLEYKVVSIIYALSNSSKPKLVYLKDENGSDLESLSSTLYQSLTDTYEIKTLDLPADTSSTRLKEEDLNGQVIMITDIKQKINPNDISAIFNQVEKGSSLIVLDDGVDIETYNLSVTKPTQVYINDLLNKWNITINSDIVYDLENASLLSFNNGAQGRMLVSYPYWANVNINQDIPLLKDLGGVVLPWGSSVTFKSEDGFKSLLTTGNYGGLDTEPFNIEPKDTASEENLKVQTAGVVRTRGGVRGAVMVVGTPNILSDQYGSQNNNLLFVHQLIDLGAQNDDLASIRVKDRIAPSLTFDTPEQKNFLQALNIFAGPLLIIAIGGFLIYKQRRNLLSRLL